jgi:hypothetical protein
MMDRFREPVNGFTHLAGAVLALFASLACTSALVCATRSSGGRWCDEAAYVHWSQDTWSFRTGSRHIAVCGEWKTVAGLSSFAGADPQTNRRAETWPARAHLQACLRFPDGVNSLILGSILDHLHYLANPRFCPTKSLISCVVIGTVAVE